MKKIKRKKMKPGRGKSKGSAFERRVARNLSHWLTVGEDGTQLVRSQLSGGWAAGRTGEAAWHHVGDLAPNGPTGARFRRRFAVECKHHRQIDLWALWTRPAAKNTITGWWRKLQREIAAVDAPGLQPMLLFHANHQPLMVALPRECVTLLGRELAAKAAVFRWLGMLVLPLSELVTCPPDGFLDQ